MRSIEEMLRCSVAPCGSVVTWLDCRMRTQYEKYLFSLIARENETTGGSAIVVDMKNASLLLRNVCVFAIKT